MIAARNYGGRRQLSREGRLSDILEKLIEQRVAEKQLADNPFKANLNRGYGLAEKQLADSPLAIALHSGRGRRQLSREGRLSDILEKLMEKRVAERKVGIWCQLAC